MVGVFVLGVLMGWLAEWLYFTFWVKPNEADGDCSALKAELELKNKQISSLQSQLGSATESSGGIKNKASPTAVKPKAVKASKANTKAVAKTTSKSAAKKSAVAKKRVTTKKTTANKKTSVPKRTTAKSTTTKKASATKSKIKSGGDDLTKISGIGPSMAITLNSLGINSYKKLAATDDDILRDMLEASGARMNNNKEAMDSWNEQATVAAKGDLAALKKMQAELKKIK